MLNLIRHADSGSLVVAVADRLAEACRSGLRERGGAVLALAGGNTPQPVYKHLSTRDLDWPRIRLVPTDERWVRANHPARNDGAIAGILAPVGAVVKPLSPPRPARHPDTVTALATLEALGRWFDAVLLGMGVDGHFASLFPGSPALATGLDPGAEIGALAVSPDPLPAEAPYARVTLTLSRLLASRVVMLAITGRPKLDVLRRAAAPDADPQQLPVAALLGYAGRSVEIHWSP